MYVKVVWLFFIFSPPTGPFIERAIIASHTSEALWFKSEDILQKSAAENVEWPVSHCKYPL